MRVTFTRASALLLAALLLTGCGAPPGAGPMTRVGPTDDTGPTGQMFGDKMLAEIAANEQQLGRVLAPARIIRIKRLREDERYELRHFDGSNPDGLAFSPSDGPGWMVEAVGTFIGEDAIGSHGFHLWDDPRTLVARRVLPDSDRERSQRPD